MEVLLLLFVINILYFRLTVISGYIMHLHRRLECKVYEGMVSLTVRSLEAFAPEISIVFVYSVACYLLDLDVHFP